MILSLLVTRKSLDFLLKRRLFLFRGIYVWQSFYDRISHILFPPFICGSGPARPDNASSSAAIAQCSGRSNFSFQEEQSQGKMPKKSRDSLHNRIFSLLQLGLFQTANISDSWTRSFSIFISQSKISIARYPLHSKPCTSTYSYPSFLLNRQSSTPSYSYERPRKLMISL